MRSTEPAAAIGYLRPKEAARYLQVSPRFLARLQSRRQIPAIKMSRRCTLYRREDLDAALMRWRQEAVGE